jgi:hypothetical protein
MQGCSWAIHVITIIMVEIRIGKRAVYKGWVLIVLLSRDVLRPDRNSILTLCLFFPVLRRKNILRRFLFAVFFTCRDDFLYLRVFIRRITGRLKIALRRHSVFFKIFIGINIIIGKSRGYHEHHGQQKSKQSNRDALLIHGTLPPYYIV